MNHRKIVGIVILVVCLLCQMKFVSGQEINIIPNGDFSEGLDGWGIREYNGDFSIGIDEQNKYSGKDSVKIECKNPKTTQQADFLNKEAIKVEPGQIYLLSCYIKGKNIPKNKSIVYVYFSSADDPNDTLSYNFYSVDAGPFLKPFPNGTFDWQQFTYYIGVPNGKDNIRFYFAAPPSGTMWYSDIKVIPIGKIIKGIDYKVDAQRVDNYGKDALEGYLSDGIIYPLWRPKITRNIDVFGAYTGLDKGITISLNLPFMSKIDKILVFAARMNDQHKIQKMEVFYDKYGQLAKVGEVPGFWEHTELTNFILEQSVHQNTKKIELKFYGEGYLSISEIVVLEE